MILFKEAAVLHQFLQTKAQKGQAIGFVPTMGALHDGHRQLVMQSCRESDLTVVSIFVNPTQFNDPSDFEKYPSAIETDIQLLASTNAQVLFLPSVKEMYPHGTNGLEKYELGYLETILEGKFRPGHFQGVCQVMCRLLKVVQPSLLYMGQKDFQQCLVISKLIRLMNMPVQLIIVPTIREHDGLAMSSRNRRLTPAARAKATAIYRALDHLKKNWMKDALQAKNHAVSILKESNFRIDYIEVADAQTLTLLQQPAVNKHVALIAAFLEEVRLIDNLLLDD